MAFHQEAFVHSAGTYGGDHGFHTCHHIKFCDHTATDSGEMDTLYIISDTLVTG